MQFPTELTPWPTEGLRRVSVASFGYGGSNAHIVLDDAFNFLQRRQLVGPSCSIRHSLSTPRANSPSENKLPSQVFMWSTEDEAGIDRMIESYSKYFQALDLTPPEDSSLLSQIASTLTEKRSQLKWRSFAIVDSITAIGNNLKDIVSTPVRAGTALNAGYIFTGQGAQYAGMGLELLSYPIFRQIMKQCELEFQNLGCSWSLLGE